MIVTCKDNLVGIRVRGEESMFTRLEVGKRYKVIEEFVVKTLGKDNVLYVLEGVSGQFLSTRFEKC